MGNINREGGLDWKDLVYSNNEEDIEKFKLLHNDLLFNRTNSSEWVGKTAIYKGERPAIYAGYIIRLRTIFVNADYINFVMNSQYHRNWCNDVKTDAVNQSNINAQKLSIFRVPLPPIEEQKRIVKEIKRWLSLIKVIKNGKENLQESIKQIKSKVLDLAIHGKLVPQDPNEEPAIELLKRINPKAEITCDTPQYGKLPKGWCSCTLRNVCSFTNGFAFSSDAYKNNGIPLVRISNITNEGKIDLNSCVYIQDEIDEQYIIEKGDFLVAMSGATTGKMGVYTYGEISYLNQRVGKIKASKALYTPYMHYLMYSQVDNILKMAYGGAQPNISAKAILAIRILLPPLAEQQRIVAKIEDLFTQFDKIEASL